MTLIRIERKPGQPRSIRTKPPATHNQQPTLFS